MRRPLEYADRPRLAWNALPRPDAAHRHRGRGDAKVVQMEIRHFSRAGIFAGGDFLRHAGMAALKRRLVLAQRLDEVPAEFGTIHDRDDPVVAGPRYFEVVDGQLVAPVGLAEVPPALRHVGGVDLARIGDDDDAAQPACCPMTAG